MPREKKVTPEQIIGKLPEAEVGLAQGKAVSEVVRKLGVTEQTYSRWKRGYGGLRTDQAKWLKDLEKKNARLKRLLAHADLDKAILRRRHRETSEPGEAVPDGRARVCNARARCGDRTPGMPGAGTGQEHAASESMRCR